MNSKNEKRLHIMHIMRRLIFFFENIFSFLYSGKTLFADFFLNKRFFCCEITKLTEKYFTISYIKFFYQKKLLCDSKFPSLFFPFFCNLDFCVLSANKNLLFPTQTVFPKLKGIYHVQ